MGVVVEIMRTLSLGLVGIGEGSEVLVGTDTVRVLKYGILCSCTHLVVRNRLGTVNVVVLKTITLLRRDIENVCLKEYYPPPTG